MDCSKQLQIEGRAVEVDTDQIIEIMKKETPTLELDPRVDDQNLWFVDYLKATAQILYKPDAFTGTWLNGTNFLMGFSLQRQESMSF